MDALLTICRELYISIQTNQHYTVIHLDNVCSCYYNYTESPELSLKVLSMELKTVTDPIQLGVGLGVAQHHLEIIRKNNPQGLCVKW